MKIGHYKVFVLISVLILLCSCSSEIWKMNAKEMQEYKNTTEADLHTEENNDVWEEIQHTELSDSNKDIDIPEETQNTEAKVKTQKSVNDRTKEGSVKLNIGEELYFDLDANGIPEKILLEKQDGEHDYNLRLSISENGNKAQTIILGENCGGFYETYAFVAKVDKDNKNTGYVLMSNFHESDDSVTYCIGWKDGKIKYKSDDYGIKGFGIFIDSVEDGFFKARVRSDYLGTGWYYKNFVINDFLPEGIEAEKYYFTDYENQNENLALTVKSDIKYTDADGKEAVLKPGTKIYREAISPENQRFYFRFIGEDYGGYFEFEGVEGELTINGKSEWECFNVVFYFD